MRPALHARRGLNLGAVPMPDGSAGMGPAEASAGPDPLVGEDRLHVVFGTGQVGHALAAVLAGRGLTARVVSRHRPPELADGIDWRAADATDPDAASDAAKGAAVVYQCLNAPYTQWPERFPPLQRGVLAAAERAGALLVSLENLYGYDRRKSSVWRTNGRSANSRTRSACRSRLSTPGSRRDAYPAATSAPARNAACSCAPIPKRLRR